MDGKTLCTLLRVKGASGEGVDGLCLRHGIDRKTAQRTANGQTKPTERILGKLFALVEAETGTRPPHFTFNGKQFLDPEQTTALAAERDHWQARALAAEAREWRLRLAHS